MSTAYSSPKALQNSYIFSFHEVQAVTEWKKTKGLASNFVVRSRFEPDVDEIQERDYELVADLAAYLFGPIPYSSAPPPARSSSQTNPSTDGATRDRDGKWELTRAASMLYLGIHPRETQSFWILMADRQFDFCGYWEYTAFRRREEAEEAIRQLKFRYNRFSGRYTAGCEKFVAAILTQARVTAGGEPQRYYPTQRVSSSSNAEPHDVINVD